MTASIHPESDDNNEPTDAITQVIEGWTVPEWESTPTFDNDAVYWRRDATIPTEVIIAGEMKDPQLFAPQLWREDLLTVDAETRTVSLKIGPVLINIADDTDLTPAEARNLADALVELADAAEGR